MLDYDDQERYKGYGRYYRYDQLGLTPTQLELALENDFIQFECDFRRKITFSTACVGITKDLMIGMVLYQLIEQYTISNPSEKKTCVICPIKGHSWISYHEFKNNCMNTLYLDNEQCEIAFDWLTDNNLIIVLVEGFDKKKRQRLVYIRPHWSIFVLFFAEVHNLAVIDYTYIKECMRENFKQIKEMSRKPLTLVEGSSTPIFGGGMIEE